MRVFLQYQTGHGSEYLSVTVNDVAAGYLTEGADSSDGNSWYYADVLIPDGGPYPVKIYAEGEVVGNDLAWSDSSSPTPTVSTPAVGSTVADVIKAAYLNLGAVDIEDNPTPAQYAQGLRSLNAMLASWSRELTIYGLVDEHFTLQPGKAVYTFGPGGDFNTAWAMQIDNAFTRDTNGVDLPVGLITQNQYDAIPLKTISTRPQRMVYNPKGYPLGTLTLYSVPEKAYTLFLTSQKVVNGYGSIEDNLGIAPEYESAIEFNLTVQLAPKVGAPVTPEIAALARDTKACIPTVVEPASFDGAFSSGGRYNIYSDVQ